MIGLVGTKFPRSSNHENWNNTNFLTLQVYNRILAQLGEDYQLNKHKEITNTFNKHFFAALYKHPDSVDYLNVLYEPTLKSLDL